MNRTTKLILIYFASIIPILCGIIYFKGHSGDNIHVSTLDTIPGGFSIGKPDAGLTMEIIESPTCIHCQAWSKTELPKLMGQYVSKGKLRIVIHDFPLDKPGLFATSLIHCLPDNEKMNAHDALLSSFQDWAMKNGDVAIQSRILDILKLKDEKRNTLQACMLNQKTREDVGNERQALLKTYNLTATPTFIIPPHIYSGYTSEHKKQILKVLQEHK